MKGRAPRVRTGRATHVLLSLFTLLPVGGACAPAVAPPPQVAGAEASASPGGIPMATPREVGMTPTLGARLDSLVESALRDGAAPGAVLAVGRHGRLAHLAGYGRLDVEEGSPAASPTTLYDLASLTKVVGTTTAAMILEEEDLLDLDRPVRDYLPALDDPAKAEITSRMLLVHRAGLEAFAPLFQTFRGRNEYLTQINERPLRHVPGTRTEYSDWDLILMQLVIERVTGTPLDEFLDSRVFAPLGMRDTGFNPGPELRERTAPTEVQEFRGGKVHGEVHDENAWAMGGVAGHAGLFSTARDLAVFAQMMLNGGELAGVRILQPETIARWTARQSRESTRAIGWDTPSRNPRGSHGRHFSARSFGHTGFTGTSLWIDPERGLFVILLTNRVNPTRENPRVGPLRAAIADMVQESIVDPPPPGL